MYVAAKWSPSQPIVSVCRMLTLAACGVPQNAVQRKSVELPSASQWQPLLRRTPTKGRARAVSRAVPLALELQVYGGDEIVAKRFADRSGRESAMRVAPLASTGSRKTSPARCAAVAGASVTSRRPT
ncbi:MAG: hypothetical protein U0802_06060 [Candidatus Binatia bacterium]